MEEELQGVKIVSLLMGLSGLALVTFLFWGGLFWPFGLIAFDFMFPLVQRQIVDIFLAPIFYGAVELTIAYGLWKKSKLSRIALICLGIFWIVYAVWDNLTTYKGMYGAQDYYMIDPIAVATAIYYGIIIAYIFFSKNARTYFSRK